ncbi:gallinacin-3-like isoform X1 [Oxyura jamaicensis]|uniref:gallinacin-3-like isoform X1 n=1 Tax=Oxyura jamaicensis TaxID=8884 RepID=UPI0015A6A0D0|nr:gallinacin-3-like isoform X1 [Oxyura jamaicensis]
MFRGKQHSLTAGASGHERFLLAFFVPEHRDLHQQPCEDLLRASAMKILFLLFPFFLLFLQGTAGNSILCRIRRGHCRPGGCYFSERHIGRCSGFQACCIRTWG